MKYLLIINSFFLLSLLSCNNDEAIIDQTLDSSYAERFLNEVLDIIEANSINRQNINWTDFRNEVFEKTGNPVTIQNAYSGINEALVLLGDNHSFLIKPDGDIYWDIFRPAIANSTLYHHYQKI